MVYLFDNTRSLYMEMILALLNLIDLYIAYMNVVCIRFRTPYILYDKNYRIAMAYQSAINSKHVNLFCRLTIYFITVACLL